MIDYSTRDYRVVRAYLHLLRDGFKIEAYGKRLAIHIPRHSDTLEGIEHNHYYAFLHQYAVRRW
jgi:hypothetical protein